MLIFCLFYQIIWVYLFVFVVFLLNCEVEIGYSIKVQMQLIGTVILMHGLNLTKLKLKICIISPLVVPLC